MKRKLVTPSSARALALLHVPGAEMVEKPRNAKGQPIPTHVLRLPDGTERPLNARTARVLPENKWVSRVSGPQRRYLIARDGRRYFSKYCQDREIDVLISLEALLSESLLDSKQVYMPNETDTTGKYLTRHGVAELLAGEGNPPITLNTVAKYKALGMPSVKHGCYERETVLNWFHGHLVSLLRQDWLETNARAWRAQSASGGNQDRLIAAAGMRSTVKAMLSSLDRNPDPRISRLCESYLDELEAVYSAAGHPGEARRSILEQRARNQRRTAAVPESSWKSEAKANKA